jgi:hypothetical protein
MNAQNSPAIAAVPDYAAVTPAAFRDEIRPAYRPVVFRGLLADWPAVQRNTESRETLLQYLRSLDSGEPLYTVVGDPAIDGRLFYGENLSGVNFKRIGSPFSATLAQLLRFEHSPRPPAIAVQAASVNAALPGFVRDNPMPLLAGDVEPTLWMGNRAVVAPHFDVNDNIAVVVSGERRFTLFPPEQIGNLYVGPILDAPGGVPISMVDIRAPDFERFPRYREALASAMQATLSPGDAIYIPGPWWHGVESTASINLLVNYWFAGVGEHGLSPKHSLLHSIMSLRGLPAEQRRAWGSFFTHFLFAERDPTEHWPDNIHDVVTRMSPEQKRVLMATLRDSLPDAN